MRLRQHRAVRRLASFVLTTTFNNWLAAKNAPRAGTRLTLAEAGFRPGDLRAGTCHTVNAEARQLFPKSTLAPGIEMSRFSLPHPTAILLKVVCNIRVLPKATAIWRSGEAHMVDVSVIPEAAWCEARRRADPDSRVSTVAGVARYTGGQATPEGLEAMASRQRRRRSAVRGF